MFAKTPLEILVKHQGALVQDALVSLKVEQGNVISNGEAVEDTSAVYTTTGADGIGRTSVLPSVALFIPGQSTGGTYELLVTKGTRTYIHHKAITIPVRALNDPVKIEEIELLVGTPVDSAPLNVNAQTFQNHPLSDFLVIQTVTVVPQGGIVNIPYGWVRVDNKTNATLHPTRPNGNSASLPPGKWCDYWPIS